MRKPSVIILLIAIVTAQYARQVSYWECRLANSFQENNLRCNCERLLLSPDSTDTPAIPMGHNHAHLDDLYNAIHEYHQFIALVNLKPFFNVYNDFLPEGIRIAHDRPPLGLDGNSIQIFIGS
jgi:hypothetical protein